MPPDKQGKFYIPCCQFLCIRSYEFLCSLIYRLHDKCLFYDTGNDYLSFRAKNYPTKAFEGFLEIFNKIGNPKINIIGDDDAFLEFDDIRFFIINSSKLSCFKEEKKTVLINEIEALKDNEKHDYLKRAFNGILCSKTPETYDKFGSNTITPTLNFSENSRQQIDDEIIGFLNEKKITKDDRLNVMVLHHPEFCLHYLQRHFIPKITESGSYLNLSTIADFAICGHIHPNVTFTNDDLHLVLPHLIGGKCNPKADKDTEPRGRPLFYLYDLHPKKSPDGAVICDRTSYKFTSTEDKYNFNASKRKRIELISLTKKSGEKLPTSAISSDKDFELFLNRFKEFYIGSLISFFKSNSITISRQEQNHWYPNNIDSVPNYKIHDTINVLTIAEKYTISIDIFPSHLLAFPNYLICRQARKIKESKLGNTLYLPIVIDPYLYSIEDSALRAAHKDRIERSVNDFYSLEDYKTQPLESFLANNISNYDHSVVLPKFLKINKYVFLGLNFINRILIAEIMPKDGIYTLEKIFSKSYKLGIL